MPRLALAAMAARVLSPTPCADCKALRRRIVLGALACLPFAGRAFARLEVDGTTPDGTVPNPAWRAWFLSLVNADGNSCCDSSDGHHLTQALAPGATPHEGAWRWFQGKQPYGTDDPKAAVYVWAEFYKYGTWHPIITRMITVRDKRSQKLAETTNPTGTTIIFYSDYPSKTAGEGDINIFCFVTGPAT